MAIKYRLHRWYNEKADTEAWGIQALYEGKWMHCCEDKKALIFDTEKEAQEKMDAMKAS